MTDDSIPRSIALIVLIIAGGFFAGSETAFSYCNKIRMKTLAEDGNVRAKRVMYILERFDHALVAVLVGNNVIHVAAASVATVLAVSLLGPSGSVVSTIIMTLLVFLFSETIPKSIARTNCDGFALAVSLPLRALMWVLTPVAWFFGQIGELCKRLFTKEAPAPTMTEEEFQSIIESIEEEGTLEPEETQIIQSAVEFSDVQVKDIMTPLEQMVAIPKNISSEDLKKVLLEEKFSRFPVYEKSPEKIIGVLQSRDYLWRLMQDGYVELTSELSSPYFVRPDMKLDEVFEEMGRYRTHLAIVVNKQGNTLGLVSMEDLMEQIVGEIYDEDDSEQPAPAEGGSAE